MAFIQPLGQLRAPVASFATLPIINNVLGDVRISTDTGNLYCWMIEASSGSLSNWLKVTSSSYSDLIGAPYSTALDIDNAVKVIQALAINIALLAFNTLTGFGNAVARMFDGVVVQFNSDNSEINLDESSNYTQIDYTYYMPNKGDLDVNTKLLIHGDGVNGSTSFVDLLRHNLYNHGVTTDTSIKKFGTGSLKFNGASSLDLGRLVELDGSLMYSETMCLDFWMFAEVVGSIQPIMSNLAYAHDYNPYTAGQVVDIHKTAANKISATLLVDMGFDMGGRILTPITVESVNTLGSHTWHHIAIQKVDGYLQIWIDGILDATSLTAAIAPQLIWWPVVLTLGKLDTTYFTGNFDEIRISDTTRYTTTFTPMIKAYNTATAPAPTPTIEDVSSSAHPIVAHGNARMSGTNPLFGNSSLYLDGVNSYLSIADSDDFELSIDMGGDPVDSYTKLLLHLNNNVTDSATAKSVTNHGVTFSGSVKKLGSHSGLFNGSSGYLSVPDSDDFNFGTGDFTIDAWVNFNVVNGSYLFMSGDFASSYMDCYFDASYLMFQWTTPAGAEVGIRCQYTYTTGVWYHIAIVRHNLNWLIFINGISQPVVPWYGDTTLSLPNLSDELRIGFAYSFYGGMQGYIDEFRVSKGIARWTTDFTKLLLHLDGTVNDASSPAKTVTQVSGEFSTSVKKFGLASLQFDGVNDYLTVPDSADWDFGTGNFTIDFWYKGTPPTSSRNYFLSTIDSNADSNGFRCAIDDTYIYLETMVSTVQNRLAVEHGLTAGVQMSDFAHFAFVRNGTTVTIYKNGIELGHKTNADNIAGSTISLVLGACHNVATFGYFLNGYMDEIRVSKGLARWTTAFTPPTDTLEFSLPTGEYGVSGSSDYTIDLWIDPLSLNDLNTYIIGVEDSWKLTLDGTSNKYLKYTVVSGVSVIAPITLSLEAWSHIAIVQYNGVLKIYVNGILGASITGSATVNTSTVLTIGATSTGTHLFNGFIEEVRISNNARWTAAFTPPEVEYSSDSNTKLLLPLNTQTIPNMVIQSEGFVANYVPTSARVVIFEEDIDVIEPNVDLTVAISRDGGTTFTTVLLAKDQSFGDGTLNLYTGSVDLDEQPNGSLMVWKLTTQNNKDCRIRGISLAWR
jgi:Concanavalin A-like lectin/glucanases superfamily